MDRQTFIAESERFATLIVSYRDTAQLYLGNAHRDLLAGRIADAAEKIRMASFYIIAQTDHERRWSELIVQYILTMPAGEAPALTDAEIFDACYRELVKRWGPAGVT